MTLTKLTPGGLFYPYQLDESILNKGMSGLRRTTHLSYANGEIRNWTPRFVGSDLGLHCLPFSDLHIGYPKTQPTRQRTTHASEIKKQSLGVNTCLGTNCHGSA